MENTDLIKLDFENKKKLPKEVKNNIKLNIFKNLIAAIIVMLYLFLINFTYYKHYNNFEEYMKYYAIIVVIMSVVLLEIAYNKKSYNSLFIGIEFLACGILSLYIPYIYLHTSSQIRMIIIILPAILVCYYIIKSLFIFKIGKNKYENSLSDIKEIVKKSNDSYINEESEKTYRKKLEEEKIIKEEIKKEQILRKI